MGSSFCPNVNLWGCRHVVAVETGGPWATQIGTVECGEDCCGSASLVQSLSPDAEPRQVLRVLRHNPAPAFSPGWLHNARVQRICPPIRFRSSSTEVAGSC